MIGTIHVGELTAEPEAVTLPGGHVVYQADADTEPFGKRVAVVVLPPVAGVALPYTKGDRVLLAVSHGTGYIIGHFASATEHDGHTLVTPRAGKEVRIGGGSGSWEALMLHAQASTEIANLRAQIEALANYVATMTATSGPTAIGAGAPAAVNAVAIAITGGDAATAKGRTA